MLEKNAVVLVVFAVCVRVVCSIHCYECSSVNNSMCLEPSMYDQDTLSKFLPVATCGSAIQSADQHGFFCRKIIQTILKKGYESEVRVTRTCGWVRHHKDCYKADNEDHLETVCQCFSDGCNAGDAVRSVALLVVTAGLVGLFKAIY